MKFKLIVLQNCQNVYFSMLVTWIVIHKTHELPTNFMSEEEEGETLFIGLVVVCCKYKWLTLTECNV